MYQREGWGVVSDHFFYLLERMDFFYLLERMETLTYMGRKQPRDGVIQSPCHHVAKSMAWQHSRLHFKTEHLNECFLQYS